jgi:hypothetical protein
MRQAASSWRGLGFITALVAVIAVLSQQAGATPPPPPPISAGSHPWIVALCKFTDLSTEPSTYTPSYFNDLFAGTGSSSVDLADWWSEISYGNINVSGTKVTTQWYSLGMTRYQWAALSRYDKIKACGDVAAGDANIGNDYSKYYGIIAIFNDDSAPRTAQTTLSHSGTQLNSGDTTFNVTNGSSFPAAPFGITMDDGSLPNGGNAEEMLVTSKGSGNDWTVTRGYEGSTAQAHNDGATIKLIDGGDLGAADVGTHGITLNGKNYTLGLVVLPPQTNTGAASHETGHGYGYDHSRGLSTPTSDYQDCYDMMSFDVCRNGTTQLYTFQGDFGAAGVLNDPTPGASGPGLNSVELDVQGWMPSGRTDTFSPGSCSTTTRDLAALNYPGESGWMELRVPTNLTIPQPTPPGGTTTGDYYTVELRDASKWDRGIPQNAVLIHVHATNKYSYWVDKFGGSFIGHQGALYLADEFVDIGTPVRLAVNKMDSSAHTATVSIAAGGAGCKIATDLSYSGDTSDEFNDQATLAADLTVQGTSVPIPYQNVDLSLGSQSCSATTDTVGHAQCTIFSINQDPGSYTASASFAGDSAYNSASASSGFTINQEESQISYTGDTTSHYHDSFTASAKLTDPDGGAPIAGKSLTFTLNGVDMCTTGPTDGSGNASCSINPTQAGGTYSLVADFVGDADYLSSSDTASFTVTQEETTTTYTGPTVILANSGAATLTARLREEVLSDPDADGPLVAPNPSGQKVTISLGGQSCFGFADSSGNVQCDINPVTVPLGPETVKAEFIGDSYYQPSSDSANVIVFAFPSRGAFVLGDNTVLASPPVVTWWADGWSGLNSLSGGAVPTSFKGFAGTVTTLPTKSPANVCGTMFKTLPGNSPPPTSGVPSYMGVLVASSVTKSGNDVIGTWGKIVVVRVAAGYSPSPGHPGTGTIVATFCP